MKVLVKDLEVGAVTKKGGVLLSKKKLVNGEYDLQWQRADGSTYARYSCPGDHWVEMPDSSAAPRHPLPMPVATKDELWWQKQDREKKEQREAIIQQRREIRDILGQ